MRQIQEAKALCAKVYEQVSQAWEALMDDVELQDITKKIHEEEVSLAGLQTSLKYLSLIEKMSKVAEHKVLQQEVTKLWTQKQRRANHVAKF